MVTEPQLSPPVKADLHLHSRYSDGRLWPAEIAGRAKAAGLELAALTDHDSMEGVPEFLAAAARLGLGAVAAAEVDCVAPEVGFRGGEVLLYFPKGQWSATAAFLRGRLEERRARMERLVARAQELYGAGAPTWGELEAFKTGGADPGGRLLAYAVIDLFECLKARGALPAGADYRTFKARLVDGQEQAKPHARDVLSLAREEGGFAVLAHPGYLLGPSPAPSAEGAARLGSLLRALASWGLWGVELYHYQGFDTPGLNGLVRAAAAPLGLRFTWGSDCHGPGSPAHRLGSFFGDFEGFAP